MTSSGSAPTPPLTVFSHCYPKPHARAHNSHSQKIPRKLQKQVGEKFERREEKTDGLNMVVAANVRVARYTHTHTTRSLLVSSNALSPPVGQPPLESASKHNNKHPQKRLFYSSDIYF